MILKLRVGKSQSLGDVANGMRTLNGGQEAMGRAGYVTKADRLANEERVKVVLKELGADEVEPQFDREAHYELQTPAGKLEVFLHKWRPHRGFFWVFQRFEEPERVARLVDCNPHSGKWNFDSVVMWESRLRVLKKSSEDHASVPPQAQQVLEASEER